MGQASSSAVMGKVQTQEQLEKNNLLSGRDPESRQLSVNVVLDVVAHRTAEGMDLNSVVVTCAMV